MERKENTSEMHRNRTRLSDEQVLFIGLVLGGVFAGGILTPQPKVEPVSTPSSNLADYKYVVTDPSNGDTCYTNSIYEISARNLVFLDKAYCPLGVKTIDGSRVTRFDTYTIFNGEVKNNQ